MCGKINKCQNIQFNISGKPSYNTSPYAYSLIWGKNRAIPGFHWGMETKMSNNSICILHLQNLRDGYAHQYYSYSRSITAPFHPRMLGNVI